MTFSHAHQLPQEQSCDETLAALVNLGLIVRHEMLADGILCVRFDVGTGDMRDLDDEALATIKVVLAALAAHGQKCDYYVRAVPGEHGAADVVFRYLPNEPTSIHQSRL